MSDTQITTARDILYFSLKAAGVLGIGQTPNTEDLNDSFKALNMMIGVWNRKRWLIWHLLDVAYLSNGSQSYTLGPGQQFDIPRADRLEGAYFRQLVPGTPSFVTDPTPGVGLLVDGAPYLLGLDGVQAQSSLYVDFPLSILESREDYSRIQIKNLSTFSRWIFYDSAWPIGKVFPWPVLPASIYELHILVKDVLTTFPTLDTEINLPPEYYEAVWSNLSIRLRTIFRIPKPPQGQDDIADIAEAALATIRGANAQIPRLVMPRAVSNRGALYDVYGDFQY